MTHARISGNMCKEPVDVRKRENQQSRWVSKSQVTGVHTGDPGRPGAAAGLSHMMGKDSQGCYAHHF